MPIISTGEIVEKRMRIAAFDSSLARSAWASFDGNAYAFDAQSFIKPRDAKWPDERFADWRAWADAALQYTQPDVCIYEKPTPTGNASGAPQIMLEMTLRELCAVRRIPVLSIYPTHLKAHICGDGKADKAAMMAAVSARVWPYCAAKDEGGDIADALGIVLWYLDGAPPSAAELKRRAKKAKKVKI